LYVREGLYELLLDVGLFPALLLLLYPGVVDQGSRVQVQI